MEGPHSAWLADGKRLHLHHGPIDLIVEISGTGRMAAYHRVQQRFATILQELVDELPLLRQEAQQGSVFVGRVAQRMQRAALLHRPQFITPMAAVAGAVADEMIDIIASVPDIAKAYVNNGGDIAFYLTAGEMLTAAVAGPTAGRIRIDASSPWRGIATSGWRGRSHSLGIADSVSVVARNGAEADAAATMIANAVDLPDHPGIGRKPANTLFPDSDLGARLVTVSVAPLTTEETTEALQRGTQYAENLVQRDVIAGAILMLNNELRMAGAPALALTGDAIDA